MYVISCSKSYAFNTYVHHIADEIAEAKFFLNQNCTLTLFLALSKIVIQCERQYLSSYNVIVCTVLLLAVVDLCCETGAKVMKHCVPSVEQSKLIKVF